MAADPPPDPSSGSEASGLAGRQRPTLSNLSKETTEEDLWNLDEEHAPATRHPGPREMRERRPEAESDEPGDEEPDEPDQTDQPAEKPHKLRETRRDGPPPASRPATVAATDADFADLEEVPIREPSTAPEPPREEAEVDSGESAGSKPEPATGRREEPADPVAHEEHEARGKDDATSPTVTPEPTIEGTPTRAPGPRISGAERIALIATAVVLMGIAIWAVANFFRNTHTTRYGADAPDFPVAARFSTVRAAETYWRGVRRDGEQADVARTEVEILPAVEVALSQSGTGALRVIFRDASGDFVGDAITRSFANGRFDDSGASEVEFAATDGFEDESGFNAYRIDPDQRWHIEILEGPSAAARGSEFQSIMTLPVSALRR